MFLPNSQVWLFACMGKICPSGRICSVRSYHHFYGWSQWFENVPPAESVCEFVPFSPSHTERAQKGALAWDELVSKVIQPYKQLDNSNYTWIICVWFISSTYLSVTITYFEFSQHCKCTTPWTVAFQIPLFVEFSKQVSCLLQWIFLAQGSNLCFLWLLQWQVNSSPLCHQASQEACHSSLNVLLPCAFLGIFWHQHHLSPRGANILISEPN